VRFTYTWGLGGASAVLTTMLALTGLLLMFRYDARVDYAYTSIQQMETEVIFGSLVRAMHHWSANLLVVVVFLHLLRVFLTGGFKKGRTSNWLIGVVLLLIVLGSNFTGYLLPWDQLAYWAITVSTTLLTYIPLVGQAISRFLLAGPQVGQGALSNFYALHVVVLPLLLAAIMGYHFWKIRKNGGISQPEKESEGRVERVTTIPHLVQVEFAAALVLIFGVTLWSMLVPAPLGSIANPLDSPNPAKAAWYFLGLQELLLHMHPLAAMILVVLALLALFLVPFLDRRPDDIGVYFRSVAGVRAAVLGAILALDLTPLIVIADEYWIDLPALIPGAPAFIASGLIPLAVSLLGLILLYGLIRMVISHHGRKANHSEALLGVFICLMVSLVVLTMIGVFFRGENMALVLPF
jgi:quinol-cytochrome oxidoreductase complex cytochrome b subunit